MAQSPENPNATNEAFLREVDEELSYDRMMGFFRAYGRLVLLAMVAALAALAGWLWYQSHGAQVAGQQGEQLNQAIKNLGAGDQKGVATNLAALSTNGNEGYRASAQMLTAAMAQEKGDLKSAINGFRGVATDPSLNQAWRDVALIRQTAAEYDTLAPDVVISRLKPLAVAGKPWFGTAGEMIGMAYIKANKPDEAAKIFADIAKDKTVPESVAGRARQMAGSLGIDVPEAPAK